MFWLFLCYLRFVCGFILKKGKLWMIFNTSVGSYPMPHICQNLSANLPNVIVSHFLLCINRWTCILFLVFSYYVYESSVVRFWYSNILIRITRSIINSSNCLCTRDVNVLKYQVNCLHWRNIGIAKFVYFCYYAIL